jgi:membrane dipeptidase
MATDLLERVQEHAATLHNDALVWDNHICLPMDAAENLQALPDLKRYRAIGTDVVSINVGYADYSLANHLLLLRQMRGWLAARPDEYALVSRTADIWEAKRKGLLAVVFDVEGAKFLDGDISPLAELASLGVRWMAMAYNQNNVFAGGCHDEDSGLSDLGRAMIDEMARVGITPCCSHTGYDTALAVIDYAEQPVLFSHSNPRALHAHPRNIPDALIDRCAAKGGVIGINGVNVFLGETGAPTAQRIAEHVDYIIQRVGPDSVSIALDSCVGYSFDGGALGNASLFPSAYGYDNLKIIEPEATPAITQALLKLGHDEDVIRKVLGLNLLRIAEANWKVV